MIVTILIVEDQLIRTNVEKEGQNLELQNHTIATQVAAFVGNINNSYTKQYVDDIIKESSFEYGARILILNLDGEVLIDSYDTLVDSTLDTNEIQSALEGRSESTIYTHESNFVFYCATPIIEQNNLVGISFLSTSANHIFEDVNEIIDHLLFIFTAAVLMSVLISVIFARIISRPIESLTKSVQNITQGKYDTKVDVTSKDEIGELGNAFNMMATKLYQVDERRRKFVSNVSHELRTPMTSMKIVSETLLANSTWEESVYREFLNDIHIEVDRLNNIIDSLLYLVRVEKDDLELDYNMTYVNYLIEWVIKTLKPIADQKNIDLKLVSHNKVQIQLDQEKMQQCLLNIIGNSVKYTPEGGSVTIDLSELKEIVSIKIIDTGIGIPEKDLPFIFDRFYRVDEARARKTGGTGLGLAIAQQIVMLHQGTIEVESQFGIGTTVSIKIPRL